MSASLHGEVASEQRKSDFMPAHQTAAPSGSNQSEDNDCDVKHKENDEPVTDLRVVEVCSKE